MGKRGPRRGVLAPVPSGPLQIIDAPERPPVSWDRLVLTEEQAAEFLKRSRSWVRARAQEGKIPRYADGGEHRYYVYDLLDYTLSKEG